MNTDGSGFTLLKVFGTTDAMASWPRGGLLLSEGVLYGTTLYGGSANRGAIFALTTNGAAFCFLKQFTGPDGSGPCGSMVLGDRVIYGVAGGGDFKQGVLYSLGLPTPAIVMAPPTQTAEIGADVDLSVQADGVAPFTFQWRFNGTNLLNSNTSGTFRLTSLQPSQAGVYEISVSNAFGAVTSSPVLINVIPPVSRRTVAGLLLTAPEVSELHVERAALDATGSWTTCDVVALGSQSQWYFDAAIPLQSQQFYRAWHTNSAQPPPILDLHLVPQITLTGAVGDSLRLDRIDQFGPIDAWVEVATITLTNASQPYFDLSSIDQLKRLYRIVPLP